MAINQELRKAAKRTFFSYLKLDFVHQYPISFDDDTMPLDQYIQNCLDKELLAKGKPHQCTLMDTKYVIQLESNDDDSKQVVTLKRPVPIGEKSKPSIKAMDEYTEEETIELLADTQFTVNTDKHGRLNLGLPTEVNKTPLELGGPDKLELYRTHLVTLSNMIQHLKDSDDLDPMLVAMTTGSGKTFIQSLWYLTLQLAKKGGVFALPDRLVDQFKKDFSRLLPDELVHEFHVLRKSNIEDHDNTDAINALENLNKKPAFIIASYEELLDNHYNTLLDLNPNNMTLCFDEQHLVMENENRRVKLIELASEKLATFLTATPNEETYDMCRRKPVGNMSARQKALEGQGAFPHVIKYKAQPYHKKMKGLMPEKAWYKRLAYRFLLSYANAIEPEATSPFMEAIQQLRYKIIVDDQSDELSQKAQMPIKRKMLVLANKVEELVNIHNFVRGNTEVYADGNLRDRWGVYELFRFPNVDHKVEARYNSKLADDYRNTIQEIDPEKTIRRAPKNFRSQLEYNIYHSIINLFLEDLTGLSTIELNKRRKNNLESLVDLVEEKFEELDFTTYKKHWIEKFDSLDIGQERAEQLADIIDSLANRFEDLEDEDRSKFVKNWELDENFHEPFFNKIKGLKKYTQNHRMMFIISGMEYAEVPIEENVPFFGFTPDSYSLYDANGMLVERAKKVKRTPLQTLNDQAREVVYTPKYDRSLSRKGALELMRLGLVGGTTSNNMATGYNDLNLHTVVNIIPESSDDNNDPPRQIQSIGRNRALDPTIQSVFVSARGEETKATFDLSILEETDEYFPPYFSAEKKFKAIILKRLAKHVIENTKRWYHQNLDGLNTVSPEGLKWQTLRNIVTALRIINNKNNHKIKLSRKDLRKLLLSINKQMTKEIQHIKKPYGLPAFVRFLGSLLYRFAVIYHFFESHKVHASFRKEHNRIKKELREAEKHDEDEDKIDALRAQFTYGKAVRSLHYVNLIRESFVANDFKNIFSNEKTAIESLLPTHLKNKSTQRINTIAQENIIPLLTHFFDPKLHDKLTRLAQNYDSWHTAIYKHKDKLDKFEENAQELAADILSECPEIAKTLRYQKTRDYFEALKDLSEMDLTELSNKETLVRTMKEILTPSSFEAAHTIIDDDDNYRSFLMKLALNPPGDLEDVVYQFNTFFKEELDGNKLQLIADAAMSVKDDLINIYTNSKNYNTDAITELTTSRLKEMVMHPRFYKLCKRTIGIFTQEELCEIVKAIHSDDAPEIAEAHSDDLFNFLAYLRQKDFDAIADEFIQIDTEEEDIKDAIENIELVKIISTLKDLFEELINIQGAYRSMDAKGLIENIPKSKLYKAIEGPLKQYKTNADEYKFLSNYSRKIFYLQGLRKGMPDASKISAFANRNMIDDFSRIKDHIIHPLKWSANRTALGQKFAALRKATRIKKKPKKHYSTYTDMESTTDNETCIHTAEQTQQKDYDKAAKKIGAKISALQAFTYEDVLDPDCDIDTVQKVFDYIDHKEARFKFGTSTAQTNFDTEAETYVSSKVM